MAKRELDLFPSKAAAPKTLAALNKLIAAAPRGGIDKRGGRVETRRDQIWSGHAESAR